MRSGCAVDYRLCEPCDWSLRATVCYISARGLFQEGLCLSATLIIPIRAIDLPRKLRQ